MAYMSFEKSACQAYPIPALRKLKKSETHIVFATVSVVSAGLANHSSELAIQYCAKSHDDHVTGLS